MCGTDHYKRVGTHKEASQSRVTRDEKDVQKLVDTFESGLLNNPFLISDEVLEKNVSLSLINIATGVVLPKLTQTILLVPKTLLCKA